MSRLSTKKYLYVFGALLLGVACAKPPIQELSDAQNAINGAVQAGADDYAFEELKSAQEALTDATTKSENKDYKGAKMAALEAKTRAEQAAVAVETNKAIVKTQTEEDMTAFKSDFDALTLRIGKIGGKTAGNIKTAAITDGWSTVQSDYDAGRYSAVQEKITTLRNEMDELETKVDEAEKAATVAASKMKGKGKKK